MKTIKRQYKIGEMIYEAEITFRPGRSMRARYDDKRGLFVVYVPSLTSMKDVDAFVGKAIKSIFKRKGDAQKAYDGRFLYIRGVQVEIGEMDRKAICALLKKECLPYMKQRVEELAKQMQVKTVYKVSLRDNSSRLGCNSSKTNSLIFSYGLLSYSDEVIDSVIYHELAHDAHRNHSSAFYRKLLKYCPDYWECRKRIIKHIYGKEDNVADQ